MKVLLLSFLTLLCSFFYSKGFGQAKGGVDTLVIEIDKVTEFPKRPFPFDMPFILKKEYPSSDTNMKILKVEMINLKHENKANRINKRLEKLRKSNEDSVNKTKLTLKLLQAEDNNSKKANYEDKLNRQTQEATKTYSQVMDELNIENLPDTAALQKKIKRKFKRLKIIESCAYKVEKNVLYIYVPELRPNRFYDFRIVKQYNKPLLDETYKMFEAVHEAYKNPYDKEKHFEEAKKRFANINYYKNSQRDPSSLLDNLWRRTLTMYNDLALQPLKFQEDIYQSVAVSNIFISNLTANNSQQKTIKQDLQLMINSQSPIERFYEISLRNHFDAIDNNEPKATLVKSNLKYLEQKKKEITDKLNLIEKKNAFKIAIDSSQLRYTFKEQFDNNYLTDLKKEELNIIEKNLKIEKESILNKIAKNHIYNKDNPMVNIDININFISEELLANSTRPARNSNNISSVPQNNFSNLFTTNIFNFNT